MQWRQLRPTGTKALPSRPRPFALTWSASTSIACICAFWVALSFIIQTISSCIFLRFSIKSGALGCLLAGQPHYLYGLCILTLSFPEPATRVTSLTPASARDCRPLPRIDRLWGQRGGGWWFSGLNQACAYSSGHPLRGSQRFRSPSSFSMAACPLRKLKHACVHVQF